MRRRDAYNNSAIVNNHELGMNIGQLRNVSVQGMRHVSTGQKITNELSSSSSLPITAHLQAGFHPVTHVAQPCQRRRHAASQRGHLHHSQTAQRWRRHRCTGEAFGTSLSSPRLFTNNDAFRRWLGWFDCELGRRVRISRVANQLSRMCDLRLKELGTRVGSHLGNKCFFNTCVRKIDL